MKEILDDVRSWSERGDRVAIATVVNVKRSAPRPPGAKMAVNESGEVSGAVSGGCVEGAVVEAATEVLKGGAPRLLHFGIADSEAWDVGLPGGAEIGSKLLVRADGGRLGSLGDEELDRVATAAAEELMWAERSELREESGVSLFVDVTAPAPRLVIFGAVDYSAALCHLARAAGWRPYVSDPRSQFATRERFPDAEEVIVAWPEEAFARIGGIDRA